MLKVRELIRSDVYVAVAWCLYEPSRLKENLVAEAAEVFESIERVAMCAVAAELNAKGNRHPSYEQLVQRFAKQFARRVEVWLADPDHDPEMEWLLRMLSKEISRKARTPDEGVEVHVILEEAAEAAARVMPPRTRQVST